MVVLFVITAGRLEPHVGDLVDADRHHLGERRQDRAETRVRAGRRHHRSVEADDLPVGVDTELGRHHEVAALHQRHHVLRTGRDPLHRTSELQRGGGGREVLDVRGRLGAEAATDPRAHDTQLVGSSPSIGAYASWSACGRLMGDPTRETGLAGHREDAVGLHRNAGQTLTHHRDLGDDRRRRRAGRRRPPPGRRSRSTRSSRARRTATAHRATMRRAGS